MLMCFRDQPDCTWCTSCIANRLSNRLLETSGGTRYKLIGLLDPALSKEAGKCKNTLLFCCLPSHCIYNRDATFLTFFWISYFLVISI